MRVAQYLVLVIFGIGGLFVADNIGLIGVGLFDWDYGLDPDISRVVQRFNAVVYGALATLPMLIIGRVFRINELPIFATALVLGTVYYFLDILRLGAPVFGGWNSALVLLIPPYIVGSFASIGAMLVLHKLRPILRAIRQP